jgi:hypothetical protein
LGGAFLPGEEEFPHVFEIAFREPASEFCREAGGEVFERLLTIGGAVLASLHVLHDEAADFEIG